MSKERKRWSKVIEAHGIPITIFEKANSAKLYYNVTRDGERVRGSLKTADKKLAEDRAKAIAKSLVAAEINGYDLRSLTLGQVFGKFFPKKAPTYTDRWRKAAETRRTLFEAAWGAGKRVEDIGQSDVDHFTHLRRTGKIASETSLVTKVRDGTIEADLRWLSTVFRWARGYKVNGRPLVPSNPLDDLVRPREKNPRRPVASHDRYVRTMEKADEVDPEGRLRCMLALARYTGRRENAICQLQADDILWDQKAVRVEIARSGWNEGDAEFYPEGGIRWRAETDKMGVNSITPLSGAAREELEHYMAKIRRIGAVPVFPSPTEPNTPIRKDTAGIWLRKAEKLADLPPLTGGRFHPYRRLFAIELKALPIHDVAAAGWWSSVETVQRIYQKSEAKGVLAAIQRVGREA